MALVAVVVAAGDGVPVLLPMLPILLPMLPARVAVLPARARLALRVIVLIIQPRVEP